MSESCHITRDYNHITHHRWVRWRIKEYYTDTRYVFLTLLYNPT